eukprot:12424598-Karenia_brevis.AAC.1
MKLRLFIRRIKMLEANLAPLHETQPNAIFAKKESMHADVKTQASRAAKRSSLVKLSCSPALTSSEAAMTYSLLLMVEASRNAFTYA